MRRNTKKNLLNMSTNLSSLLLHLQAKDVEASTGAVREIYYMMYPAWDDHREQPQSDKPAPVGDCSQSQVPSHDSIRYIVAGKHRREKYLKSSKVMLSKVSIKH